MIMTHIIMCHLSVGIRTLKSEQKLKSSWQAKSELNGKPLSRPAVTVSLVKAAWKMITPVMNIISSVFAIIPTLFLCFLLICYPSSCYNFNAFFLVHVTFFSSRCMLELKFAIYYRAASLPSQASYAVLAEESLDTPRTPTVFLIQQSCVIITFRC